jgi:hypothetical protein
LPGYFAWIASANGLRELEIGLARLAPDEIGVGRISKTARDRLIESRAGAEKALDGALAR